MTKQDILNMKQSREIMEALDKNRDLWDKELSEHLKDVAKKENLELYGDENILVTPFKQRNKNNH